MGLSGEFSVYFDEPAYSYISFLILRHIYISQLLYINSYTLFFLSSRPENKGDWCLCSHEKNSQVPSQVAILLSIVYSVDTTYLLSRFLCYLSNSSEQVLWHLPTRIGATDAGRSLKLSIVRWPWALNPLNLSYFSITGILSIQLVDSTLAAFIFLSSIFGS